MPLSNHSRFVTCALEKFWESLLVSIETGRIVCESVLVAKLAGENAGTGWA